MTYNQIQKIQPGDILYDAHSYVMGNTKVRSMGVWPVKVLAVRRELNSSGVAEVKVASCSWNGNEPTFYGLYRLKKLRVKEPKLIKVGWGYRLARKGE